MAMPSQQISMLRHELSDLLRSDGPNRQRIEIMAPDLLVPMQQASYMLPSVIGGFTDFFTSVDHVSRVGRIVRPDSPLPAFKHLPMAYNGRASSVVVSGLRSSGRAANENMAMVSAYSHRLARSITNSKSEFILAPEMRWESQFRCARRPEHIFGLCLLNDWSSRDIQRWESFPLGPFLGKSFCTTISPWIVTSEALAPFRVAAAARAKEIRRRKRICRTLPISWQADLTSH